MGQWGNDDWLTRQDWQVRRKNHQVEQNSATMRRRILWELDDRLWHARRGLLKADWRERGLSEALAGAAEGRHLAIDGYCLWLEITEMPVADWEPARGQIVGWRAALDAWWVDSLANLRALEAQTYDVRTVSQMAGLNVVDASPEQWDELLDRFARSTSALDFARAHAMLVRLDRLRAWYEGGLARGGVEIDWVSRFRARVERWRVPDERDQQLALLLSRTLDPTDEPWAYPLECRLPAYWSTPAA